MRTRISRSICTNLEAFAVKNSESSIRTAQPLGSAQLKLCTADYYRDEEELPPGIADPRDSTLTRNATPWARDRFAHGTARMKVVMSASRHPWLYCASHFKELYVGRKLRATSRDKYDYDAATEITDVDASSPMASSHRTSCATDSTSAARPRPCGPPPRPACLLPPGAAQRRGVGSTALAGVALSPREEPRACR